METGDFKSIIQQNPLFKKLDDNSLNILIHQGKIKLFAQGEIIYQKGEPSQGNFGIVISGRVGVISNSGQIIAGLGPGEIIGEVGATSPQGKRTVTVRAIQNTELLEWNIKTIQQTFPELVKQLKNLTWKRVSNYMER
ncbi:predicted protein [Candidatus Vecturithrix granuli]|uniref:Cyclic nucleotide-binding domain-containing protein n=1 Tax=Vecturithrix granuli TaxID=1499967 RepID=A0A081C298_VECG1|nr:predicted protein [Candidatus Vecturithrix granuli]